MGVWDFEIVSDFEFRISDLGPGWKHPPMPHSKRSPSARPAADADDIVNVVPADKQPVEPKAPPAGRKFPCAACGAKLDFDPSSHALKCPYCGHVEEIAPAKHGVEERDYATYLRKVAGQGGVLPGRSSQIRCTGCGAVVLIEDQTVTEKCPFCGTHLENKPEAAEAMIAPEGVLPFAVTDRDARKAFNDWIASRWFAPTELRQLANLGQFAGVYLPFWTYDSMTYTHYTGQRGEDYQETETYTDTEFYTETRTNADGSTETVTNSRPVTRTRVVTKTRWYHVSGQVQHFFDDVLICGSESLTGSEEAHLGPWDLKRLEEFNPEFLSGFKTERYAIGLEEGFDRARAIMDQHIRRLCERDIGGDHQILETVNTQHVGVTFKHILLPVWIGAYRYRDVPYRVLVNARTGKVFGRRPYSWVKITALVLAILLAIALVLGLLALVNRAHAAGGRGERRQPAIERVVQGPADTSSRGRDLRIRRGGEGLTPLSHKTSPGEKPCDEKLRRLTSGPVWG
jgi:predicted RNA-binding Zn-ribbon protein involved in translation (DUF1610 family)